MALIACKHEVFGVCMVPDNYPDWYPAEWMPVNGELAAVAVDPGGTDPFNPAGHPVRGDGLEGRPLGVLDYLEAVADEAERTRVVEAERARGDAARKTVLDWAPSA